MTKTHRTSKRSGESKFSVNFTREMELWIVEKQNWLIFVCLVPCSLVTDTWAESLIETRYLLHIYCQQRSLINSTHSFVLVMFFGLFSQWTVRAILLPLAELIALLWGKRMGTNERDSTAMYCSNELSILLRATETDISIVAVKKKRYLSKSKRTHNVNQSVWRNP